MSSVIELLIEDHRTVENLFDRIEATQEPQGKQALCQELCAEFETHATAEEEVVYPELERSDELRKLAERSYKEHEEARNLIRTLDFMAAEDEKWGATIHKLRDEIDHHVQAEENKIFPRMEQVFSRDKLNEMGVSFNNSKHQFARAI